MSVPPFVLSPVTADDVESMIAVYEAAFASNPLSSLLFPKSIKPEVKAAWLRKRFLGYLAKPEIRQFKVTETSTGKLVAWSRWAFPYVLSPEEKEKRRKEEEEKAQKDPKESYPDGANVGACEEKFNGFDEFRRTWVDDENMYLVHFLATDPAYQRRGLATMLLKVGLDLADAEGRKTYIEATEDGHPVYLKLGWKDVDKLVVDGTKYGGDGPAVNYIMMRDPQPIN